MHYFSDDWSRGSACKCDMNNSSFESTNKIARNVAAKNVSDDINLLVSINVLYKLPFWTHKNFRQEDRRECHGRILYFCQIHLLRLPCLDETTARFVSRMYDTRPTYCIWLIVINHKHHVWLKWHSVIRQRHISPVT